VDEFSDFSVSFILFYTDCIIKGGTETGVFENRVLRGIFGLKGDEVIGGWSKLHSEELHSLCCSLSILRITKSRRMRWAGHVARMGRIGMHI
jgi:hypothetical protein